MRPPPGRARELDDRFVPKAAVRVRRAVDGVDGFSKRVVSSYRALDPQVLDERFASRGPLAKVRDLPLVAVLVVLAVLAGGVGLAAKRESERAGRVTEALPGVEVSAVAELGARVGESVDRYLDDSAASLTRAVQRAPNARRVALVSFADYRTPLQTRELLSGFTTLRVYVRAAAAGDLATPLPVEIKGDLATQLPESFAQLSRTKKAAQQAYQSYSGVNGLHGKDKQFLELYEDFARSSGIEAREFANGCGCVYSAVVSATPAQLLTLRTRVGVRAVEVAAEGASLSGTQVQPLQPEVTTVVPKPSYGRKR